MGVNGCSTGFILKIDTAQITLEVLIFIVRIVEFAREHRRVTIGAAISRAGNKGLKYALSLLNVPDR